MAAIMGAEAWGQIEQIRLHVRTGDIARALLLIAELELGVGRSPRLLVLKAACLQLSDGTSLTEVEESLLDAIEMDDEYVDAYIELGWFRLSVEDDAIRAEKTFDKARQLLRKLNTEAVRGALACAKELRPNQNQNAMSDELRHELFKNTEG
jgi:hypothetical protein